MYSIVYYLYVSVNRIFPIFSADLGALRFAELFFAGKWSQTFIADTIYLVESPLSLYDSMFPIVTAA